MSTKSTKNTEQSSSDGEITTICFYVFAIFFYLFLNVIDYDNKIQAQETPTIGVENVQTFHIEGEVSLSPVN